MPSATMDVKTRAARLLRYAEQLTGDGRCDGLIYKLGSKAEWDPAVIYKAGSLWVEEWNEDVRAQRKCLPYTPNGHLDSQRARERWKGIDAALMKAGEEAERRGQRRRDRRADEAARLRRAANQRKDRAVRGTPKKNRPL